MSSPIRRALTARSSLRGKVEAGLGAFEASHKPYVDRAIRSEFADSLDLDAALRSEHPREPRWDYLLGHEPTGRVLGLEPHSAQTSEVGAVIAKRRAAISQLRGHLVDGRIVDVWVATGPVDFVPHEEKIHLLAQNGIKFVGKTLQKKDRR